MSRRDLTSSYDQLEAVDNLRKMRKENPDPLASLSLDVLLDDLSACCVDRRLVEFNDRLVEVRRRFRVLEQRCEKLTRQRDESESHFAVLVRERDEALAEIDRLQALHLERTRTTHADLTHLIERAESAERERDEARGLVAEASVALIACQRERDEAREQVRLHVECMCGHVEDDHDGECQAFRVGAGGHGGAVEVECDCENFRPAWAAWWERCEVAERDLAAAREALRDGIEAFRLTRDYVGPDLLPETPGWSWFDWTTRAVALVGDHEGGNDGSVVLSPAQVEQVRAALGLYASMVKSHEGESVTSMQMWSEAFDLLSGETP